MEKLQKYKISSIRYVISNDKFLLWDHSIDICI